MMFSQQWIAVLRAHSLLVIRFPAIDPGPRWWVAE